MKHEIARLRRLLPGAAAALLAFGAGKKKTTIGGQALIEGIMMKGPKKTCICVRKPDKELVFKEEDTKKAAAFWKLPVFRGMYGLFSAMKEGVDAINYSASFFEEEEASAEPSKFEKWLESKLSSDKLEKAVMGLAMVIGIGMPVVLFFVLPALLVGLVPQSAPFWTRNVLESAVRIVVFLLFMWSVSHMKDIRRTFEYHGGEHKTIFCYEDGLPLTVENVRGMPRFHPRCGTSFLFVMILISIVVFSAVFSLAATTNPWLRMALRLLMLPFVVGIAYEINRYAGRYDNALTNILRWPGIQMQHLTVFEPDDSMIEVAIEAMKRVIPDDGSDNW
ncbi:DUF1385 domain-containing protein [Clostridiaceae bacterium]|nr:DUF1385 domain-containing protein [Clostridiaceae bacterium]